jgi:hypothetical protein
MVDIDPDFQPALEGFDLADLESSASSICALRAGLTIAYTNPAWRAFALANGALPEDGSVRRGASYLAAVSAGLMPYYAKLFEEARRNGQRVDDDYECSSAALFRQLRMSIYPLFDAHGFLVVHTLRVERPHSESDRVAIPMDVHAFVDENGLVTQCAHCRRVQRVVGSTAWDWVPDLVRNPFPRTSFGICPVCIGHYFGRI